MRYKASYYTHAIPHDGRVLLSNGATGALVRLGPATYTALLPFLGPARSRAAGTGLRDWAPPVFTEADMPDAVRGEFHHLVRGGFVVPADHDEQRALKERMESRKASSPLYLRITTTLDCNYRCYYCFEDKSPTHLTRPGSDSILRWAEQRIEEKPRLSLFTDWFGGEPMLNQEAIEYISERAIEMCEARGIHYGSAITCNGSHWPDDAVSFVRRNRIGKIQLTLDGPADHHRRRRRERGSDYDSYAAVTSLIDRLFQEVPIYLRINVDPAIGDSVLDLIPEFVGRGWLSPGAKVYPYLALIGPMNSHCGQLDTKVFRDFRARFDEISRTFQERLAHPAEPGVQTRLPAYPAPMRVPCSAVNQDSVIFGPDGLMYKCVLDIGHPERAYDQLAFTAAEAAVTAPRSRSLTVLSAGSRAHSYETYDPFSHPRCSQCQYLPVCLGGCPKDQIEGNEFYLQERSAYFENNYERLIVAHAV